MSGANRLMAAQEEIALSKNQALIGTIQKAMVEGRDEETQSSSAAWRARRPRLTVW